MEIRLKLHGSPINWAVNPCAIAEKDDAPEGVNVTIAAGWPPTLPSANANCCVI